jgi:DNA primase
MVCTTGKYSNRIIIPYYGPNGNLIYWNSRDMATESKLRYMGPDSEEVGVGKGDVIYMESWPKSGKVYLTEGEFDAMSLTKSGLHGGACGGKALTDKQLELLRPYSICICFDTDKSGETALNKIGDKLISSGIREVSYVRPPVDSKNPQKKMDWNKMLVELGERIVELYISTQEKPFTYWTSKILRFNNR